MERTKRKNKRSVSPISKKKKLKMSSKKQRESPELSEEKEINSTEEKVKEITINEINDITEKLSNSAIYCRENEREKILSFLSHKSDIKTMFISGQPGTGKTSLVLDILDNGLSKESKFIFHLCLNCISLTSSEEFYNEFFKHMNTIENYDKFKKCFDKKGYDKIVNVLSEEANAKNFTRLMNYLKEYNIAIVLDEIDFLYQKSNEISFYEIINIPYISGTNVKMILISNNSDFDNEIFPKLKNRKIQIEKIVFKPYTHVDLFNIMKKKLEDINMINCFSDDSIRFLSTKLNKSGDLRPIIETVKNIILSNKESFLNHTKTIELKDMFAVIKKKNINLSEIISSMTTEQKVVAAALYYAVKSNGIELEEKNIYEKYKIIKKQTHSVELCLEEFREVIKSFCEVGLIETKTYKKSKSKKNSNMLYRVKYSDEDLEIIFMDEMMYTLFKSEKEEDNKDN